MADDLIQIHLFSPGFEEFFIRYAQQIGKGEVFVETTEILPVNTPVELVFLIVYEDMDLLRATGVVSYVTDKSGKPDAQHASGGHPQAQAIPGMGVRITELGENFRAYIVELMKRQIRSDLSRMFTT